MSAEPRLNLHAFVLGAWEADAFFVFVFFATGVFFSTSTEHGYFNASRIYSHHSFKDFDTVHVRHFDITSTSTLRIFMNFRA